MAKKRRTVTQEQRLEILAEVARQVAQGMTFKVACKAQGFHQNVCYAWKRAVAQGMEPAPARRPRDKKAPELLSLTIPAPTGGDSSPVFCFIGKSSDLEHLARIVATRPV